MNKASFVEKISFSSQKIGLDHIMKDCAASNIASEKRYRHFHCALTLVPQCGKGWNVRRLTAYGGEMMRISIQNIDSEGKAPWAYLLLPAHIVHVARSVSATGN